MNAFTKGLVVMAAQLLLAGSVGAKFLLDRVNYPSVWAETAPYDPDLPIRGRYVRIAVLVDAARTNDPAVQGAADSFQARLEVRNGRLVAVEDAAGKHWAVARRCGEADCWQLAEPLAYFIPEHVQDPSRRPAGETLWVEVTVPPKGPPRPIALGTKRAGDAAVTPLDLAAG